MTTAAVLLVAVLALRTGASDEFAVRFEQARTLFDGGRYPEAAAAFDRLQADSGEPALLYPTAQSFRLAGRCAEALRAYEAYVAAAPDLRARVDAKRLANELQLAEARIIEMRVCLGRVRAATARVDSQRLAAAGNQAGALTILESAWNETQDPTLLPDLAAAQRADHACGLARTTLKQAALRLGPIEGLADDPQMGSDLLIARRALQEARAAAADQSCVDRPTGASAAALVAQGSPAPARELDRPAVPEPDRGEPRVQRGAWPLIAAAAGGALVVGGGALIWKAHDEVQQGPGQPVTTLQAAQDRSHNYSIAGVAVGVGGAAIGTAALLYYFSSRNLQPTAKADLQLTAGGAVINYTAVF